MVVPVIWLCVEMQGSILCACLPFVRKLFTATTAHTRFSTGGSKSAPGHESLEKLEGRGQNTPTARACAESGQSVGEEKFSREFDQEK